MDCKNTTKKVTDQTNLPLFIEGNKKLSELLGIQDKARLQQLRMKGLPYYTEGKIYIYKVSEVTEWYTNYLHNLHNRNR